jgi:hypothetical protein
MVSMELFLYILPLADVCQIIQLSQGQLVILPGKPLFMYLYLKWDKLNLFDKYQQGFTDTKSV